MTRGMVSFVRNIKCFMPVALMCLAFNLQASDKLLDRIESLRVQSPEQAISLLSTVDVSSLNEKQRNKFDYLTIFLDSYRGDFKTNLVRYRALLPRVKDSILAFKIRSAMMLSFQATNDWENGLLVADSVLSEFEQFSDKSKYVQYLQSTGAFYDFLDEHELALDIFDRILQYDAPSAYLCFAKLSRIEIFIELQQRQRIDASALQQTVDECKAHSNELVYNLSLISLAEYWLLTGEPERAISNLLQAREPLFEIGYPQGELSYQALEIQIRLALGQDEMAEQIAFSIIQDDNIDQYVIAAETAHEQLAKLYAKREQYERAYYHQTQFTAYRLSRLDNRLSRQRAIQQAKFDSIEKQAMIETLDAQNALLRYEAKLAAEQFENSLLAFGFLASIFTGLMVWSYRGRRLQKRFEHLANTDSLTQIDNRMAFINKANDCLAKAQKRNAPVSLIMLDLDKFKHINDRYGHQAGDWALQKVASVIKAQLDPSMVFARMGGEEFAILKVGFGAEQATRLAEHCRAAIEAIDSLDSGYDFKCTASFGVVDTLQAGYKLETLITGADLALFQSKNFGRNQVFQYSQRIHF